MFLWNPIQVNVLGVDVSVAIRSFVVRTGTKSGNFAFFLNLEIA